MKKIHGYYFLMILFISWILLPGLAWAQEEFPLKLSLSRDFGYSSGTGQIQGTFSMKVTGPDNLSRVVFLIDDQPMGEITAAPFKVRFKTDSYPLGVHTLSAVGYTADGQELHSNGKKAQFVEASEGWKTAGKIVLPILGILVGISIVAYLIPAIFIRGKKSHLPLGAPRHYGIMGGTICPKCNRPFGIHIWGLNMVIGKLDRCPHCGKWSLVTSASQEALRAAETAEMELDKPIPSQPITPDEADLRKELENSRYTDQ